MIPLPQRGNFIMKNRSALPLLVASLAIALLAAWPPSPAKAQEGATQPLFSLDGGVNFTTAYYFRGARQEDAGFIAQPYANLSLASFKVGGLTIGPSLGVWNSFHDQKGPIRSKHHYELDLLGGVKIQGLGPFILDLNYTYFNSPSNAFDDIHEAGFKVSYDDSALVKTIGFPFALNPYVSFAFETRDNAGTEDEYWEVGIAPSFKGEIAKIPFNLSVPVKVGMSLDSYYTDKKGRNERLGYVSVASVVGFDLPAPKWAGKWSLSLRVEYLYLDAASLRNINDDREPSEVIGTVGLAVSF